MRFSFAIWCLILLALAACERGSEPSSHTPLEGGTGQTSVAEIDQVMARGVAFLVERQEIDGAWRSEVYGAFKRGDALTPLALRALIGMPSPETEKAVDLGSDYLTSLASGDDPEAAPPLFAVYTAAQAIEVLSRSSNPQHLAARDAWVAELEGRQLTSDLGWSEDEAPFGGWGYSTAVPRKPTPGALQPPLLEANISATVFALQGLRAAELPADGSVCRQALVFLERMQNFADPASSFDDGGFHFIDDDPVRNKAGVAGSEDDGSVRFSSYGSTTADGLRGMLLCGRPPADRRVEAARSWLEDHFSAVQHPGAFAPRLAADRDGLYYYWAASVAQTLRLAQVGPKLAPTGKPPVSWAEDLARELIARQGADGSWVNPIVTMREDEPIIATSMALVALAEARLVMSL